MCVYATYSCHLNSSNFISYATLEMQLYSLIEQNVRRKYGWLLLIWRQRDNKLCKLKRSKDQIKNVLIGGRGEADDGLLCVFIEWNASSDSLKRETFRWRERKPKPLLFSVNRRITSHIILSEEMWKQIETCFKTGLFNSNGILLKLQPRLILIKHNSSYLDLMHLIYLLEFSSRCEEKQTLTPELEPFPSAGGKISSLNENDGILRKIMKFLFVSRYYRLTTFILKTY